MSPSTYSESDGRLHRARKAMRKIVALGLSKDELLELYLRIKERRPPSVELDELAPSDRHERRQLAQDAIRTLVALGFAECDIAELAGVAAATITRALDPLAGRVLKPENVQRLISALEGAGAERLNALLPRITVNVVDTCCDKGLVVDPTRGDQLETAVRHALSNVLLGLSPQTPLAPGIEAALYELGEREDGVVVAVAPLRKGETAKARLAQIKALEHELQHLRERLADERRTLERALGLVHTNTLPANGKYA